MDPAAIREQISRLLQSRTLANKGQLRKLLQILSSHLDSQDQLTTELVIKELWPAETKTKQPRDVATEMNRLRHTLEVYYQEEGRADSILIELPNRAPGQNGAHERIWITAKAREPNPIAPLQSSAEKQPAVDVNPRRRFKMLWALAAAVLGVVAFAAIRAVMVPNQPKFGRLNGSALIIFDGQGKELWRKEFPQGFGPDTYYGQGLASRLWFTDLEGKGHTNVLFSYWPAADSQTHSSTLICYSDHGKEKWHWIPGRDLPEVDGPAKYKTFSLVVLRASANMPSRIVVLSAHDPWYGGPSQIAVLDSNGKTLSEYWHSGGLSDMVVADLDGVGREEIIATGNAHGYDAEATLVALDKDRVFGASTEVQSAYQIHGMGTAQERLRLLFPRSDLSRDGFRFNYAVEPSVHDGNLRLSVMECPAPRGCPISYEFDKSMHLIAANAGAEEFRSAHNRFYQNGKGAHPLSTEEQTAFLKIRCLAGCKSEFVPIVQTDDPAASFEKGWSMRNNPNGVWSYGYSSGFTAPITLYDKTVRNGINGPNVEYWLSPSVDVGTSPSVGYNNGAGYNDGNSALLANELDLVAGIRGQYSNVIFTAPADGEYSIAGSFRGAQYGVGTVVGIVANAKVVFSSSVTSVGQVVPFNLTVDLQAGRNVAFSVGPGSGSQNTGLSVTITKPCGLSDKPTLSSTGQIICSGPIRR